MQGRPPRAVSIRCAGARPRRRGRGFSAGSAQELRRGLGHGFAAALAAASAPAVVPRGVPRAAPRVAARLSRGRSRGLPQGCPAGCPAGGCPADWPGIASAGPSLPPFRNRSPPPGPGVRLPRGQRLRAADPKSKSHELARCSGARPSAFSLVLAWNGAHAWDVLTRGASTATRKAGRASDVLCTRHGAEEEA